MLVTLDNCQVYAVSPLLIRKVLAGGPNSETSVSTFLPRYLLSRFSETCCFVAAHPAKASTVAIIRNNRTIAPLLPVDVDIC
jgi:hypothetical protein